MVVYDLWDIETGNIIGTFESEGEALRLVRELVDVNGHQYADALDLGWIDGEETGSIAGGAALLDLALTTSPSASSRGAVSVHH